MTKARDLMHLKKFKFALLTKYAIKYYALFKVQMHKYKLPKYNILLSTINNREWIAHLHTGNYWRSGTGKRESLGLLSLTDDFISI